MARKRLTAILTSTILAVGALALPAGAAELDTGTVSTTSATLEDEVTSAIGDTEDAVEDTVDDTTSTVEETADETITSLTDPVEDGAEEVEETVDGTVDEVEDTVDDLSGATGTAPTDDGDDGDDGDDTTRTSSRTYRSSGEGVQPAPAPEDPLVAPGRSRTFDRSHLSGTRSGAAASSGAPGSSESTEVAEPEIAAPEVAPAASEEQVLALPVSAPEGPVVPAPLRVLATALVLAAAGSWTKAWHESRA